VTPAADAAGSVAAATSYLDRLAARSAATGTVLCLGIDPDPAALPPAFEPDVAGVERFARLLVEAAAPHAAAVKPNLAFFEAFGSAGLAALERIRAAIPGDIPVVLDAKRGDIGSTAARQAVALYDILGAAAITVSPYLGEEAIAPLLERTDRLAYVLCRTSNPGAPELQSLVVDDGEGPAEPLYLRVARRAAAWGPGGTVGLVVGATAPAELARIREVAPGLPFLVPGVGAQGGEIAPVLADGPAREAPGGRGAGGGLLVNVTRGVTAAAAGLTRERAVAEALGMAAAEWAKRLPVLP
jgi:orotidine-5'-phosphate decarboxylase